MHVSSRLGRKQLDVDGVARTAGTYTLIVSSFEPRHEASFTLKLDSTLPLKITPIPQEGAGMFNRTLSGTWYVETAGSRI